MNGTDNPNFGRRETDKTEIKRKKHIPWVVLAFVIPTIISSIGLFLIQGAVEDNSDALDQIKSERTARRQFQTDFNIQVCNANNAQDAILAGILQAIKQNPGGVPENILQSTNLAISLLTPPLDCSVLNVPPDDPNPPKLPQRTEQAKPSIPIP